MMDRVVAFVDILGFKNLVNQWTKDKSVAKKIEATLARSINWIGGTEAIKATDQEDWSFQLFSDCLVIDVPLDDLWLLNLFKGLAAFQRQMFQDGYLVRGGIAIGEHYKTELITLSAPLVEAHDLESKRAVFPRILLSDGLTDRINRIKDSEFRKELKEYLVVDSSGMVSICYLIFEEDDPWYTGEEFYLTHKRVIEESLSRGDLVNVVREKHIWLASFHNWCIRTTSERLKKSGKLDEDIVWDFSRILIRALVDTPYSFESCLWTDKDFEPTDNSFYRKRDASADWVRDWPGLRGPDDESHPDDLPLDEGSLLGP